MRKKPLVLYRAPNRDPIMLGIQNQGLLSQVPTLPQQLLQLKEVQTVGRRPWHFGGEGELSLNYHNMDMW